MKRAKETLETRLSDSSDFCYHYVIILKGKELYLKGIGVTIWQGKISDHLFFRLVLLSLLLHFFQHLFPYYLAKILDD